MFTLEVIGAGVHQLVLQHVSMGQTGEYRSPDFILSFWVWVFHNLTSRCQVTLPLSLCLFFTDSDGAPRKASCHLGFVHQTWPPSIPPWLPTWGQAGHQLHSRAESPRRLPHLAGQQEEGGQVDGHLLPPHNLPLWPNQFCLGSQLPRPCRALSRAREGAVGDMQVQHAANQGGGDARWAQPALGPAQQTWCRSLTQAEGWHAQDQSKYRPDVDCFHGLHLMIQVTSSLIFIFKVFLE